VARTSSPLSPRGLLLSSYVLSMPRPDFPIPGPALPEIALAGRSNVGKSSLLNLLVGRRALARMSATPGKTRALNVFDWGGRCYLVDVPGYGWAKAGRGDREAWRRLVEGYVTDRPTLRGLLWLLDIRRDPSPEDAAFGRLLAARRLPVLPVATKADHVARPARAARLSAIAGALGLAPTDVVVTSARTREGQEELRDAVLAFLD
jgi:GTP-binding protein